MIASKIAFPLSMALFAFILFFSTLSLPAKTALSEYAATFDLGPISLTEEVAHEFSVVNHSKSPLKITDVESSCECLKILSFPDEIPPQGEGKLKLKLLPPKPGEFAYEASLNLSDKTVRKYLLLGTIEDKGKRVNPELWIPVSEVKNLLLNKKQDTLLIDIRPSDRFNDLRIPDSLNIPLYHIKAKPFLKGKKLILITEGFEYAVVVQEMEKLSKNGFDARLLKGGLLAWKSNQGETQGRNLEDLALLTPEEFFPEKDVGFWIKVDCDEVKIETPCHLITNATHLPANLGKEELLSKIRTLKSKIRIGGKESPWVNLLFFNKEGDYREIRKKIKLFPDMNLFFLKGGLLAYEQFIHNKEALLNARTVTRKMKSCRGCP